jgi:hypothetical protein
VSDRNYTPEKMEIDFEVPPGLLPLVVAHPRMLPGENVNDYYFLLEAMVSTVLPVTDMEWLATVDLAWLMWEIQRYRRWKNAIIMSNRTYALEAALCKTHPGYAVPDAMVMIRAESRMQMQEMSKSSSAHGDVRARLASNGYDEEAINAGAFARCSDQISKIDKLLISARHEIRLTLRDVESRREFYRRASEAMKRLDTDPTPPVESKQVATE